ncbi:Glycosyl hydrolase 5 family protein [Cladobotryum mycophilum]|uniref:Glycosyl hydrolase 5 family protein n=1 Tax=Cladobotryum mycophilum TaxID=491253 RepID=A0ABR0S9H4_9HYPO
MKFLFTLLGLAYLLLPLAAEETRTKVPLSVTSRWIIDRGGNRVKLRCVNWAAHLETNIPEGLHKQSINWIASWIATQGFNCVRLTYSTDMALNHKLRVKKSFQMAAKVTGVPQDEMKKLFHQVVEHNPFIKKATLIDVFDAVHNALWNQNVMTIIDNHVSRAGDCCTLFDGNGWWDDAPGHIPYNSRHFNTSQWYDGLVAMAKWSRPYPGIVGMSLRNELRATGEQVKASGQVWRDRMLAAANKVNTANPDVLIMFGGMKNGTDLRPITIPGGLPSYDFEHKRVWEAHAYNLSIPKYRNCHAMKHQFFDNFAFVLTKQRNLTGPLFISEFGIDMSFTHDPFQWYMYQKVYEYYDCLKEFLWLTDADWALWALQGSYYVRFGELDRNEPYGVLNKDWTDWRRRGFWKKDIGQITSMRRGPHTEDGNVTETDLTF